MFNFTQCVRQSLLALSLLLASAAASAGPTYLVTIHTQAYSGESGLIDFGFFGDVIAAPEVATLSNFSGAFGELYDSGAGVTGDLASGVSFVSDGLNAYLTHNVILGGDLSFTLAFSGDFALPTGGDDVGGLSFVIGLFNSDLSEPLAQLAQFDLWPAGSGLPASIVITHDLDLVDVVEAPAAVPEPSQLLLLLSALALAGLALRRRA